MRSEVRKYKYKKDCFDLKEYKNMIEKEICKYSLLPYTKIENCILYLEYIYII